MSHHSSNASTYPVTNAGHEFGLLPGHDVTTSNMLFALPELLGLAGTHCVDQVSCLQEQPSVVLEHMLIDHGTAHHMQDYVVYVLGPVGLAKASDPEGSASPGMLFWDSNTFTAADFALQGVVE